MVSLLLAASVFFTDPAVLEMPRAEAYLVKPAKGPYRLEDRYNVMDLWVSRAVWGRWMDADGRVFTLSDLATLPPARAFAESKTRERATEESVPMDRRDDGQLVRTIAALSPVPLAEDEGAFIRPRQGFRGYKEVRYYEGTNTAALVCAYRPDQSGASWHLATWELAPDDDVDEMRKVFERQFLGERLGLDATNAALSAAMGERELLRADARHSIAAYPGWHFTSSDEFAILDNLPSNRGLIAALTNEMPTLRRAYAATVPSTVDGTNTLAVVRIYANRADYLDAVGEAMKWSAAYWSPQRRELVAYLPADGVDELMRTLRHEAFHQYLSYATAMVPTSPWLNEGYAQYFEDPDEMAWKIPLVEGDLDRLADLIPALLKMDYADFYAGTDDERRTKYRLAWSLAQFIEKGAPNVRFAPFANLKKDYVAALLQTREMSAATDAAFGSDDKLKLFITEWKKFWEEL